jgi:uncharacterized protein YbjT (DUF2867 family)
MKKSKKNNRILVTGATGYIASRLIPRLLEAGYPVRVMVRDKSRIKSRPWYPRVEVFEGDVIQPASLPPALANIHSAFYLIHNMSRGKGYQQAELDGARNFARTANQAGVEHIIYLGGLADPNEKIASHLRSRIETGAALREFPVPVTEFRAGVITGPGSISFEMIRFICEQFPILLGPGWLRNRSHPISAGNMIDYLAAALNTPECRGQIFEIGGPETFHYHELMQIYAQIRGLPRGLVLIPGLPTDLMAFFVDKLTPVPFPIAHALINGLRSDSIVKDPRARKVFPQIKLTPYRQAVKDSLALLHPTHLHRVWENGTQDLATRHEGFLVESLHCETSLSMKGLRTFVEENLPGYQIEFDKGQYLRVKNLTAVHSECWLEWEFLDEDLNLRQTGMIAPKGLLGFLTSKRQRSAHRRIFRQINSR